MGWRILTANRKYIGDDEGRFVVARLLGNEEQRRSIAPLIAAAPAMQGALLHIAELLYSGRVHITGTTGDLTGGVRAVVEAALAKTRNPI